MTRSDCTSITLAKSTLIRLSDNTREVRCESGSLWITLDADPRDYLLEPGQQFRREGSTGAIVYALTPARMALCHDRAEPVRASRNWWALPRTTVAG